jgi:protein SCO1/2
MVWTRRLIWAALVVAGIGAYAAQHMSTADAGATTGDFGRVPSFALVDQTGKQVTDRDLHGKPWVANFVFTRCPSVCPMLSAKFQALQAKLRDVRDVRYVSISVDPEYDTPAVLAAYAQRFSADPIRWQFLTGPLSAIEQTVVKGFKIHMGAREENPQNPTLVEIMHGEHFVLVDQTGEIRGYYRADNEGLAELEASLRALAR